jgi:tRNA-(ms[2]io[6]A)-hydroxylase
MLCLKCPSSAEWLSTALAHLDEVLVDHAHCEHKAAVTALSFISKYPDDPELVRRLSHLASEEADHLRRVAEICAARGLELGHPDKDPYAKALLKQARGDQLLHRVDRLLVCALIEARSCERLKLLAENLEDAELRDFYDELWRCEAGHYTLFKELAERALVRAGRSETSAREEVSARVEELADFEAELLEELPVRAAVH